MLPFGVESFFAVFRSYNETFWPFQLVLVQAAIFC